MNTHHALMLAWWFLAVPAWGASTETCPSIENGIWLNMEDSAAKLSCDAEALNVGPEYYVEKTTWSCLPAKYGAKVLWKKVPYKIEWVCYEWSYKKVPYHLPSHSTTTYGGQLFTEVREKCIRQIGFREDGIVLHRKVNGGVK